MTYEFGLLNADWLLSLGVVLLTTHLTILSVTIYLHRHQAHSALSLHPSVAHAFRFWLWFSTGTKTKEWVSIHRKHHAFCETTEDPHSPVVLGLGKVLSEGYELYLASATEEVCNRFGKRTPDDWIERNIYSRFSSVGIALMAAAFLALFGVHGIWMWAVQMIWIPFFAAGVVNGVGHTMGYRNFECTDNARNLVPFGFLIGGEEMHNNHHSFPNCPKMSQKWFEVDIGWFWIRTLECLGLAKANPVKPMGREGPAKEITSETISSLRSLRLYVTNEFKKRVLLTNCVGIKRYQAKLLLRPDELLSKDDLKAKSDLIAKYHLEPIMSYYARLRDIYSGKIKGAEAQVEHLKSWCRDAEESGNDLLNDFANYVRGLHLACR